MTFSFLLVTLVEIFGAIAVIWCLFHEAKLIELEDRFIAFVRARRMRRKRKAAARRYYAVPCRHDRCA